jgi:hypothetical protein
MASKKCKKFSDQSAVLTDNIGSQLSADEAELLSKIPWFNERYLLPGESLSDYDTSLQLLVESVVVNDALDAILVKDIHDELREVQRLRVLRQSFFIRGMASRLSDLLSAHFSMDEDPRVTEVLAAWREDPKVGNEALSELLDELGVTMDEISVSVFTRSAKNIQLLEQQLARHEKNVRESLKMIDARRNHALVRERLAFDLERDRQQQLTCNSNVE